MVEGSGRSRVESGSRENFGTIKRWIIAFLMWVICCDSAICDGIAIGRTLVQLLAVLLTLRWEWERRWMIL